MMECPNCERIFSGLYCQVCGWRPPSQSAAPAERTHCPHDRAPLTIDGICQKTGGYPAGFPCPFVCPICRHPLEWDGRCEACHGCTTGNREDWAFPGDRYDCYDDNGKPIGDGQHWIKTDGPRKALSPAESKLALAAIQKILSKSTLASGKKRRWF